MVSAATVVGDYIIAKGKGAYTPMQVIKLAYIGHGYTLAIADTPLFNDRVEAWQYGPVIPTLYHALKQFGAMPIPHLYACHTPVNSPELETKKDEIGNMLGEPIRKIVDKMLEIYGSFNGYELSDITHMDGSPWNQYNRPKERHVEIPNHAIKEYYKSEINGVVN